MSKIIIVGDAGVQTGFARCTHALADELHRRGHEVSVLGINYYGDPHGFPYPVHPCRQPADGGVDGMGVTRLPLLIQRLAPDAVVILNDPWNIGAYFKAIKAFKFTADQGSCPVIGWVAVDAMNQKAAVDLSALASCVVWTDFAKDELARSGATCPISVIPLGVDERYTSCAVDRATARGLLDYPQAARDKFVVGAVGRNQPRKRLDLTIRYFAEFVRRFEASDALLYLHVAPTGETGCDIPALARFYGVASRVMVSQTGFGFGLDEDRMPLVYASLDLYVTTTSGEGWGMTTHEAMACGVPCIVPAFGALAEWTRDGAAQVRCSQAVLNAPLNGSPYTIGMVPDEKSFVSEMASMYRSEPHRRLMGERARRRASDPAFSWGSVSSRVADEVLRVAGAEAVKAAAPQEEAPA